MEGLAITCLHGLDILPRTHGSVVWTGLVGQSLRVSWQDLPCMCEHRERHSTGAAHRGGIEGHAAPSYDTTRLRLVHTCGGVYHVCHVQQSPQPA